MEYQKIKGKKHYVFSSEEEYYNYFDNAEKPKHWKDETVKEGDWVYADDGGIVQLLKVSGIKHPSDRKNYSYHSGYVRTVVGTFLINNKSQMDTDFSQHRNRYTFSKTLKDPNENVKKRKNVTRKEKMFATNVAVGMGPVKSYMDAFNEESPQGAKKKAVVLLKQERVMSEIEKSVLDVAKSMGIDHEYVLNKLKCLADFSEDDNIVLQSTKEIGKVIGTSVPNIKTKEMGIVGMFQGFSPEQIGNVERKQLNEENKEIDTRGNDKRVKKDSSRSNGI